MSEENKIAEIPLKNDQNDTPTPKEDTEEWGGWKIVSDMLDNPDKDGIYPTSECYDKLYNFVVAEKYKTRQETRDRIISVIEQVG